MTSAATRVGLATTILTFVAGISLFMVPFLVDYQDFSREWTEATRNDLGTGGAPIGIAALTFLVFLAFVLRDAADEARRRAEKRNADGE